MPKKPYADSRLALFVTQRIMELRPLKTQADIAAEAGYANHNNITMIKQGAIKLPLDRVPAVARALDVDTGMLLRLTLEQAAGTAAISIFEQLAPLSRNERAWLEAIRDHSGDTDPPLTHRARTALRGIFGNS